MSLLTPCAPSTGTCNIVNKPCSSCVEILPMPGYQLKQLQGLLSPPLRAWWQCKLLSLLMRQLKVRNNRQTDWGETAETGWGSSWVTTIKLEETSWLSRWGRDEWEPVWLHHVRDYTWRTWHMQSIHTLWIVYVHTSWIHNVHTLWILNVQTPWIHDVHTL